MQTQSPTAATIETTGANEVPYDSKPNFAVESSPFRMDLQTSSASTPGNPRLVGTYQWDNNCQDRSSTRPKTGRVFRALCCLEEVP